MLKQTPCLMLNQAVRTNTLFSSRSLTPVVDSNTRLYANSAQQKARADRELGERSALDQSNQVINKLQVIYEKKYDQVLEAMAQALSKEISQTSREKLTPPIKKFDPISFEKSSLNLSLFDTKLPTMLMIADSDFNQELFLISRAAQIARAKANPKMNVVIATEISSKSLTWTFDSKESKGGLYLNRGIVIDHKGIIHYGKFPKPVPIDLAFNSSTHSFFESCSNKGISLINNCFSYEIANAKNRTNRLLQTLSKKLKFSLVEPLVLSENDLESRKLSEQKIRSFIQKNPNNGLVIKPSNLSLGEGVEMISQPIDIDDCLDRVRDSIKKYKSVMLEPWIESFPITNYGEKQDWNFRFIANPQEAFLTEARIHTWGQPVNKALGARICSFDSMSEKLQKTGVPEEKIETLHQRIKNISTAIAQHLNLNYVGLDFIVDKDLEPWIIEINSGAVGGMCSVAELNREVFSNANGLAEASNFVKSLEIQKNIISDTEVVDKSTIESKFSLAEKFSIFDKLFLKVQPRSFTELLELKNLLRASLESNPDCSLQLHLRLFFLSLISESKADVDFALQKSKSLLVDQELVFENMLTVSQLIFDQNETLLKVLKQSEGKNESEEISKASFLMIYLKDLYDVASKAKATSFTNKVSNQVREIEDYKESFINPELMRADLLYSLEVPLYLVCKQELINALSPVMDG